MNWKNKKIIVTGGSSGIGKHLIQLLKAKGASLVFGGLNQTEVARVADELQLKGIAADLTKEEELVASFQEAIDYLGTVDILINNAGYVIAEPFDQLKRSDFEHMFALNSIAPARLAQLALPYFLANGAGDIVNIGATGGYYAFNKGTAYSSSKAALSIISKNLNLEHRKDGVRTFHLDPSWCTDTNNGANGAPIPQDDQSLNPSDITATIVHMLEMDRRAFVPQISIWGSKG